MGGDESADRAAASAAMDRYAQGDAVAFGTVYDLLAPRLLAFLIRQTRDRAAAEDLVQQTFLQMHCARASYIAGADVTPWAFAIARRLVVDRYRRGKREVLGHGDGAAHGDGSVSTEPAPDDALQTKQAAIQLEQKLAALPESQRAAFELIKYDGLSVAQAAEVLGTTVMAIKLRAHRAYEALRSVLADGD